MMHICYFPYGCVMSMYCASGLYLVHGFNVYSTGFIFKCYVFSFYVVYVCSEIILRF